jgi:UDP-glucose:(heptosyl)LPS alpha-1,3-glucosyltransferase
MNDVPGDPGVLAVKKISLALIRQRYAADGGAERFVARTLEALKGQEVRITLIARQWQQVEGVDVVVLNPFYIGRLWRDWSFARAVQRLLQQRHFDLVQSHERIAGCDIYRAGDGVHREWLAQRARVLPAWRRLLQAINPYHLYVKWAERQLFTNPNLKAVICNSKMVKQEIKHWFGVADAKLNVIYNGVNLERFHPRLASHRTAIRLRHRVPEKASLFLFVGSGFERKGVAVLLEALAQLPPSAYLIVVGRDKSQADYQRQARRLGLGERAIFVGSQQDVKPFYGAADAAVLPTLYDPFPNVVLEAMACGLPVITSLKCGAAEFLRPDVDGFVCDALDRDALAKAMRRITTGFVADSRARVEKLTLENMSAQLQRLYAGLVTSRTGA